MVETYTPTFIVEVGGRELPKDITRCIETFSYEDDEKKMDELKLTIYDADLSLVDNEQLQEGKEIRVRWGYLNNLSDLRTCTIKEISYKFGEDGIARMEIKALDKRHKLTGRAARTCWHNKTTADIVRDIAKKHQFKSAIDIPDDFIREYTSQGGKNDMLFLNELANDAGCSMWVVNDELHFEPSKLNEPILKFRWREDKDGYLQSLSISSKAEQGKGTRRGTEAAGLEPLTKQPIKESVKAKAGNQSGETVTYSLESGDQLSGSLQDKITQNETPLNEQDDEAGRVVATPAETKAQAKSEAKGKVHSSAMGSIEATASTIGLPYLKAKDTITIENVGKKFSGSWRIINVRHSISKDNYTCELKLRKADHGNLGSKKAGAAPKVKNAASTAASAGNVTNNKPVTETYSLETGARTVDNNARGGAF